MEDQTGGLTGEPTGGPTGGSTSGPTGGPIGGPYGAPIDRFASKIRPQNVVCNTRNFPKVAIAKFEVG